MRSARVILALVRADFLERVRRTSFLVTLGFTVYAAVMFVPENHTRVATLNLGGHRGIYNSAWVGNLEAMLAVTFLALAGFYVTKNAIERDRRTGVGPILAATPLSKWHYALGKMLSNFTVLSAMVGVLVVVAGVMQLVRGEDMRIDPVALASPFVLIVLPVMALVASLAVLFETIPGLRGGLGNVVYFFFWIISLSLTSATMRAGILDPVGGNVVIPQMLAATSRAYPDYHGNTDQISMGFNINEKGVWHMKTFAWEGPRWSAGDVLGRAGWVAAALGLTAVGALVFDRFDASPMPAWMKPLRGRRKRGRAASTDVEDPADAVVPAAPAHAVHLTPLPAGRVRGRFGALVVAESRLMLKRVTRWWYLVALGLLIATLPTPLLVHKVGLLLGIAIWPLFILSPLGSRESRHGTEQIVFSSPRPVTRLLFAQWIAGCGLMLAMSAGVLLRLAIAGQGGALVAVVVGALFVPALALALGVWTGGSKAFEILYLLLWYMGPMNHIPFLDYSGASAIAVPGRPADAQGVVIFAIAGASLLVLAVIKRASTVRG